MKILNRKDAPVGAMNIREATLYIDVSERMMWRLKANVEIPHSQIGGRNVFRKKTLDNFLEETEVTHV